MAFNLYDVEMGLCGLHMFSAYMNIKVHKFRLLSSMQRLKLKVKSHIKIHKHWILNPVIFRIYSCNLFLQILSSPDICALAHMQWAFLRTADFCSYKEDTLS